MTGDNIALALLCLVVIADGALVAPAILRFRQIRALRPTKPPTPPMHQPRIDLGAATWRRTYSITVRAKAAGVTAGAAAFLINVAAAHAVVQHTPIPDPASLAAITTLTTGYLVAFLCNTPTKGLETPEMTRAFNAAVAALSTIPDAAQFIHAGHEHIDFDRLYDLPDLSIPDRTLIDLANALYFGNGTVDIGYAVTIFNGPDYEAVITALAAARGLRVAITKPGR